MDIPASWTFETKEVAEGFDNHVREQLPWYDLATNAITHIARHYIPENGIVYDIGCATGNIGQALEPILDVRSAKLIGIDPSIAMRECYQAPGEFVLGKAESVEYEPFDLGIVFLTLMFVEYPERRPLMLRLIEKCRPGGALIVFDKLEPQHGYLSTVMYRLTLAGKLAAGASPKAILEKELSLSGVQRPLKLEHLPCAPYQWFRFGDFAGWIIEKDG